MSVAQNEIQLLNEQHTEVSYIYIYGNNGTYKMIANIYWISYKYFHHKCV